MQNKDKWIEDAVDRFRKGCQELQSELANAAHGTFLDASDDLIMNNIEPLLKEIQQKAIQEAIEKAQTVIENERLIKMTTRSANAFFDTIENPPVPNKKLKDAMKAYKGSFDND